MPVVIIGTVEDVKTFTGKNGFGATITLSRLMNKRRKTITFNVNNAEIANKLELHLQEEVEISIVLEQNNFGLRFGDVIDLNVAN